MSNRRSHRWSSSVTEGIGAEHYLTASVGIDREEYRLDSAAVASRARRSFDELERGVRAALGAHRGRIVASIFSLALLQIGAGLLVGSGPVALVGLGSTREVLLLLSTDGIMLLVGLTACAVPVRRALRIDPTEAMRAEA